MYYPSLASAIILQAIISIYIHYYTPDVVAPDDNDVDVDDVDDDEIGAGAYFF